MQLICLPNRSNLLTYMATSKGILQAFELCHQLATDSIVLLTSWVFCVLNHECAKHLHYFSTGTCGHNPCVYTFLHTPTKVSRSEI